MKLLFVFPYSQSDYPAAIRSATLINKFGLYDCDLLIQPTKGTPSEEIEKLLRPVFQKTIVKPPYDVVPQTWPAAPNHMFRRVAQFVADSEYDYFYFFEPDVLPCQTGWLAALRREYETVAIPNEKVFMGVINQTRLRNAQNEEFVQGVHMVGTGFYPKNVAQYAVNALLPSALAWDVAAQGQIVPWTHHTDLIQHNWSTANYVSLRQLNSKAVVHHGCKDESLYELIQGIRISKDYTGAPDRTGNNKPPSGTISAPNNAGAMFIDPNRPVIPEPDEGELPSMYDAVLPHAISLLQSICRDKNAKKKIFKELKSANLIPAGG